MMLMLLIERGLLFIGMNRLDKLEGKRQFYIINYFILFLKGVHGFIKEMRIVGTCLIRKTLLLN